MRLSVSAKVEVGDWGQVWACAIVSENPFYGTREPDEPRFDIEEMQVRDSKNRVIYGRCLINRSRVYSLEAWEISLIEGKLIEAYQDAQEMEADRKADEIIETMRAR